jgi:hypothetical protein
MNNTPFSEGPSLFRNTKGIGIKVLFILFISILCGMTIINFLYINLNNSLSLILGPFIIFFIILFFIKILVMPLNPYHAMGKKVERRSHFIRVNNKQINQSRKWKEEKIKEQGKGVVRLIYGEFKDNSTPDLALEKGLIVEAVFGPKLLNLEIKKHILKLMNLFGQRDDMSCRLFLYIVNRRPERHAVLIGPHLLIEDPHAYFEEYETAIIIEDANDDLIDDFNGYFDMLKSKGKEATIQDIENMKLYESDKQRD